MMTAALITLFALLFLLALLINIIENKLGG